MFDNAIKLDVSVDGDGHRKSSVLFGAITMRFRGIRCAGCVLAFLAVVVAFVGRDLLGKPSDSSDARRVSVDSLNSGEFILIGKLGHPYGTYHDVAGTFGMPGSKGDAGNGERLYLRVLEIDGVAVKNPLWLPYYKSMTLQTYELADGTDLFPRHPNTHILNGKHVRCKVYESFHLLDRSGDVSEHYGNTRTKGFDSPYYESSLAIMHVLGVPERVPSPFGQDKK